VDEREAYVPELDAIRGEVVRAWKLQEDNAVRLARAAAEEAAQKVRDSGKSLTEVFGDQPGRTVRETDEVRWLTSGNVPADSPPSVSLSSIPEVDGPGLEFRETMFRLRVGQIGVAPNQNHTLVYVIRILSETPDPTTMRDQFLKRGATRSVGYVAMTEHNRALREWYQGLLDEIGFQWARDPQGPSRAQ
jgi:hypothetical protein